MLASSALDSLKEQKYSVPLALQDGRHPLVISSLGAMTGCEVQELPLEQGCISQLDARMCAASFTSDPVLAGLGGEHQGFWESSQFLLFFL